MHNTSVEHGYLPWPMAHGATDIDIIPILKYMEMKFSVNGRMFGCSDNRGMGHILKSFFPFFHFVSLEFPFCQFDFFFVLCLFIWKFCHQKTTKEIGRCDAMLCDALCCVEGKKVTVKISK